MNEHPPETHLAVNRDRVIQSSLEEMQRIIVISLQRGSLTIISKF